MGWILIISLLVIAYVYAGYPLLMALRARGKKTEAWREAAVEPVSVVIAAYRDALPLKEKIRNLLASEGAWIGEVLVGSDGSPDDVAGFLAALNDDRIRVQAFPNRRGKTAVLNDLVPQCRYGIVVMMDARQQVKPGTLRALVRRFSDERVGVVSGELIFGSPNGTDDVKQTAAAEGMGAYWRYEKWIRKNEARVASVPGATGACYAIRKKLFRRIPDEIILDDVAYPMQAVLQGYRCVFEEEAVVFDRPSEQSNQESVRKRRTLAGNVQLLSSFPEFLNPQRNPIWFQFVSHKLLRLFVPFLAIFSLFDAGLCILFETNAIFGLFSRSFLVFSAFFAVFCVFGAIFEKKHIKNRFFSLFWMFFVLNRVTFWGVLDGLRGKYRVTWEKAYEHSGGGNQV